MGSTIMSRRKFVAGTTAFAGIALTRLDSAARVFGSVADQDQAADYALRIKASAIEIAPRKIISAITYNGQFPGPLLRFKAGRPVTVAIHNDTDAEEQLHWHGQRVPVDVDGAAEEGTPYIPPHGKRRIAFT